MHKFNRLLPEDGIIIYPNILYKDVNDISMDEREKTQAYFKNIKSYGDATNITKLIKERTGNRINRYFCVYVYKGNEPIACLFSKELINNPDGYSFRDFELVKLVYEPFQHTKYSRYVSSDFLHMMFISNIADKIYTYVAANNINSNFFLDVIDREKAPCVGAQFSTDGINVQKYILVKQRVQLNNLSYIIIECSGNIYRSMDLRAYLHSVPGRSDEMVSKWLEEMNAAAEEVYKVNESFNDIYVCN